MTCDHASNLGDNYPGCFCIYCGRQVARIDADGYGHIYLESELGSNYLAVIHKNRQRAVEGMTLDQGRPRITFKGDSAPTQVDTTSLISAFQDEEEVLKIT